MTAPWLTAADLAEQEVRVRVLVDWWAAHVAAGCNDRCRCPELHDRIEELLRWREQRSAESFAAGLRRLEEARW